MAMPSLLGYLFNRPCEHEFSWPDRLSGGGYYQTCARCGNQFAFDWETMARGERIRKSVARQPQTDLPTASKVWVPRARRFTVRRPIFYRPAGQTQFCVGMLLDISESGVLLECQPLVPEGQTLEMIFVMPREITGEMNRSVLIMGKVVRTASSALGIPLIGVSLSGYHFLAK